MSVPKTMPELIAYVEQKRRQQAEINYQQRLLHGFCHGLTDKEYNRMKIDGKKTYSKARNFTHNKMWRETHKRFDTKQLKLIKSK